MKTRRPASLARDCRPFSGPGYLPAPRGSGFSVLEMMGVILILGFLVTMIFPALNRMRSAMERRRAGTEASALAEAVLHYRRIYDTWPPVASGFRVGKPDGHHTDGDFAFGCIEQGVFDQTLLISALSPTNHMANPRQVRFLQVEEASLDERGRFCDPWGNVYTVALDGDNNGRVDLAAAGTGVEQVVDHPVAVFSPGERQVSPVVINTWEQR